MWCCPSFCLPSWAVTSTKLYERNLPTIRDDFYIYIFHIFCHTCHLCFLHSLVKKTNCDLKESPSAEGAEDVLLTCMSLLVMWSSVSKRCDHSGVIFQIRLGWWFCFDVDFLFGFFWSLFCFLSNSKPIRITCINLRNLKKKKKENSEVGECGQSRYFPFQRGTQGQVLCWIDAVSRVITALRRSCCLTATGDVSVLPRRAVAPLTAGCGVPAAAIPSQLGLGKGCVRTRVTGRAGYRIGVRLSW